MKEAALAIIVAHMQGPTTQATIAYRVSKAVLGTMSPYPTVVIVVRHQKTLSRKLKVENRPSSEIIDHIEDIQIISTNAAIARWTTVMASELML